MTDTVLRIDAGTALGKVERLDSGGARIPARLTRVGVFVYRQPDGVERRELRLPEEVFKADSLATYKGAPVTIEHPPGGRVDPDNWRDLSVGHTEDVRTDAKFVEGDLVVNDSAALSEVESGKREVSCGYRCRLDWTAGEWDGEQYDAIQRDIKINHVAIVSRGRAGPEVALRLDSHDAVCVEQQEEKSIMAVEKTEKVVLIKLDGRDVEYGGEAHIKHLETRADAADEKLTKARAEVDRASARADAAEEKIKQLEGRLAESVSPERLDALAAERAELIASAKQACGESFNTDGLSERELKLAVIRADRKDFEAEGKSDDYISAAFDFAKSHAVRADGIEGATRIAQKTSTRTDAKDPVAEARAKANESYRTQYLGSN